MGLHFDACVVFDFHFNTHPDTCAQLHNTISKMRKKKTKKKII